MSTPAASIYNAYSRIYDVFEFFFRPGIERALSPITFRPGHRVLDIGIGSGFSLRHYPPLVLVTGIDASPGMLAAARRKVARATASRIQAQVQLLAADAHELPFPAGSFDLVFMSHVIATVADPCRCLAQAIRVTREGGILVLLNHFRSGHPLMRRTERALNPLCRHLGWRTDLSLGALMYYAGIPYEPEMCDQGLLFDIVYLQKSRGKCRMVRMPAPTPKHAPLPQIASSGAAPATVRGTAA